MKFRVVDNADITNGSHLQGYVTTTFDRLVETFGQPDHFNIDTYKVTAEWRVLFKDGTVATIYDWKEDRTPKELYDWHIGGFDSAAVARVKAALAR